MSPQDADEPPRDERAKRRKAISKTVRFEVFKRDQFTCQYCGRKAPDVILEPRPVGTDDADGTGIRLHIDHIEPRALGGADDVLNYVTACADCNLGKGARPLADDSVMAKRRTQLDELAARREQMEMLYAWQHALGDLEAATRERLADYWHGLAPGFTLNDTGKKRLARLHASFSVEEIMAAMRIAATTYLLHDEAGAVTHESWEHAFMKIGGVCKVTRDEATNPDIKRLYYIRGILRKLFPDRCNDAEAIRLLKRGARLDWDIDWMEEYAKDAYSYYRWRRGMEDMIAEAEAEEAAADDDPPPITPAAPPPRSAPPPTPAPAPSPPPAVAPRPDFTVASGAHLVDPQSDVLQGVGIATFGEATVVTVPLPSFGLCGADGTTSAMIGRADESLDDAAALPGVGASISVSVHWQRVGDAEPAARMAATRLRWAAALYAAGRPGESDPITLGLFASFGRVPTGGVQMSYTAWVPGGDLEIDLWRVIGLHKALVEVATQRFPFPALAAIPDACAHEVQSSDLERLDLPVVDTLAAGTRIAVLGGRQPRAALSAAVIDLVATGRADLPLVAVVDDVLRDDSHVPTGDGLHSPAQAWLDAVSRLRADREGLAADGLADVIPLPPSRVPGGLAFRLLAIPSASDDRLARVLASFAGAGVVGAQVAADLIFDGFPTERARALGYASSTAAPATSAWDDVEDEDDQQEDGYDEEAREREREEAAEQAYHDSREREYRQAQAHHAAQADARAARIEHLEAQGLDPYDAPDDGIQDDELGDTLTPESFADRPPFRPAASAHAYVDEADWLGDLSDPGDSTPPPPPIAPADDAGASDPTAAPPSLPLADAPSPDPVTPEAASAAAADAQLARRRERFRRDGARFSVGGSVAALSGVRIDDLGADSVISAEWQAVPVDGIRTMTTMVIRHAPPDGTTERRATLAVTASWPRPAEMPGGEAPLIASATRFYAVLRRALTDLGSAEPVFAAERPELVTYVSHARRGGGVAVTYRLHLRGDDLLDDVYDAMALHEALAEAADAAGWVGRPLVPRVAVTAHVAPEALPDGAEAAAIWPAGARVRVDGALPGGVVDLLATGDPGQPVALLVEDTLPSLDPFQSAEARSGQWPASAPPNAIRHDDRERAIRTWLQAFGGASAGAVSAGGPAPVTVLDVFPPSIEAGAIRFSALLRPDSAVTLSVAVARAADLTRAAARIAAERGVQTEIARRAPAAPTGTPGESPMAGGNRAEAATQRHDREASADRATPPNPPDTPDTLRGSATSAGSSAGATAESRTPAPSRAPMRVVPRPGRNEACPCGSGSKYKRCCGRA